jgi:RimJ/RimL family protein N-acetyltransferase
VIIFPQDEKQWVGLANFIQHHANVVPAAENKYLGWIDTQDPDKPKLAVVVCFNHFMGHTCEIHVAMAEGYKFTPKAMLREVFQMAFDGMQRKMLVAVVAGENVESLRFVTHLGFEEAFRFDGMTREGGDIVILTMTPEQCKHYKPHEPNAMKVEPEEEVYAGPAIVMGNKEAA